MIQRNHFKCCAAVQTSELHFCELLTYVCDSSECASTSETDKSRSRQLLCSQWNIFDATLAVFFAIHRQQLQSSRPMQLCNGIFNPENMKQFFHEIPLAIALNFECNQFLHVTYVHRRTHSHTSSIESFYPFICYFFLAV